MYDSENTQRNHFTIAIRESTKNKLDKHRAPGQCYNGFICQLLDRWEESSHNFEASEEQGVNNGY
jgi:hypothetical protein